MNGKTWTCPRLGRVVIGCLALATLGGCSDAPRYQIDASVVERPLPGPETPLDSALVNVGAEIFRDRCLACHKLGPGVAVGPDLSGVTLRREPQWIRAMVMNPDSMLRQDSVARALLYRYQVPMMDTETGEPEFRALLEFLRAQPPSG